MHLHVYNWQCNSSIDVDRTGYQSVSIYRGSDRSTYQRVECDSVDISCIVDQCSAMFVRLIIVIMALCLWNGAGKIFFYFLIYFFNWYMYYSINNFVNSRNFLLFSWKIEMAMIIQSIKNIHLKDQ